MADIQVTLVLDDSQYTGKLTEATKAAEDFGNKTTQQLTKTSDNAKKALEGIDKITGGFERLATIVAGVGFFDLAKSALVYADRVEDLAKASGLAIHTVLEFDAAVRQAGGGTESASKGISTFYQKLDEAAQGAYTVQFAFQRLGVSLRDIATLSDKQLLFKTVEQLDRLGPGTEQTRLAIELFGKAFKGIPIEEVNEKLKKLSGTMVDEEAAIQKAAEASKRLQKAADNLKIAFIGIFGDTLEKLGQLNQDGEQARKTVAALTAVFLVLVSVQVIKGFLELVIAMREFAVITGIAALATSTMAAPIVALITLCYLLAKTFFNISDAWENYLKGTNKAIDATSKTTLEFNENAKSTRAVFDETKKLTAAIDDQIAATKLLYDNKLKTLQQDILYTGMTANEIKLAKNATSEYEQYATKRLEVNKRLNAAQLSKPDDPVRTTIPAIKRELSELDTAYQQSSVNQQQAIKDEIAASRDWNNAMQLSIKQYVSDATDGATQAKKIFDDATKGMEDAIVEFAKTGHLSFQNMLAQIAEDMLRSNIKQIFASLFTSTGAQGTAAAGGSIFGAIGSFMGFADGGTIPTNNPVLVGERGPEIISGAKGMNVTPNNALSSGSPTYVTYHINAVDAPSFKSMIAADPSFIYAVSQQGARTVPGAR